MQEHHLKVSKTARYFTIGSPGSHIRHLIIACHGYGQAVRNFAGKFSDLDDGATHIIMPEGLSRFYFGGFTGNIGASWMTKEDRLNEIEDYCRFIETVYRNVVKGLPNLERTTLFGFSQGCPTIMRWAVKFRPEFQNLVLWAGDMAHDIDYKSNNGWFNQKNIVLVVGDHDEFLTEERMETYRAMIKKNQLQVEVINFEGKHVIDRKVLKNLIKRLK